jgi:hypothetical protein
MRKFFLLKEPFQQESIASRNWRAAKQRRKPRSRQKQKKRKTIQRSVSSRRTAQNKTPMAVET